MKTLAAIPCFNEELAIGSAVLKTRKHVDEVLVVDDGSTDATAEVARAAGATIVSHQVNKGKGTAIKSAFDYAATQGFDILVLLDGDGQHDPNQIPLLIKPIQEDNADVVIGFRGLRQMPFYRRVGRVVLDITTAAGSLSRDSQSGFRALNRKAVEALQKGNMKAEGFSIESEMILAAQDLALRIQEVPITVRYDIEDMSTKNPVSHGVGVLNSILRLITEKRPLLFMGVPGFVFILIGFYFGLTLLRQYNQSGYFSMPYTMLAGFFVLFGALGVFLGLLLKAISNIKGWIGDK